MTKQLAIAVAKGDGIGSEIMSSVLKIFQAARVPLEYKHVDMGKEIYLAGKSNGMTAEAQRTVEELGILFKGPMETPKGTGVKSINVTARKVWNTFANKRVFKTFPGVDTVFSRAGIPIDITIYRENIEDTYGGIEHFQTRDVAQCRRLITRPGSLQFHEYAFLSASKKGCKRITCAHKANIMKLTDGLFLETFYQVAKKYPELKADDIIIDDLAMKLVKQPDAFDVVLLTNLQGDIMSDLCAGLVGGLGIAPSANIGQRISIFEAVHGTAPDLVGKNMANPTALLLSGLMMLRHLDLKDHAQHIQNSLEHCLKEGLKTKDLCLPNEKPLSTTQYTEAVIQNFPSELKSRSFQVTGPVFEPPTKPLNHELKVSKNSEQKNVGIDMFVDIDKTPNELAKIIEPLTPKDMKFVMISNRGTQVWPTSSLFTECVNHYRVRFECTNGSSKKTHELLEVATAVSKQVRICSLEILLEINGKKAFTLAQGQ